MKTVMISKHIHSCMAAASSKDIWLQFFIKESEMDFMPSKGDFITSKKYRFLNGETVNEIGGDSKFMSIYLESDKTFYNKGLHERNFFKDGYEKTDEFKSLIGSYIIKGWRSEENEAYKLYREREEKRDEIKSKKSGIVLWMSYDNLKKAPLSIYQGGFSDEVFNTSALQEYISSHCAYGWIGDSGARRKEHDILIEQELKAKGLNPDQMYNWISSSDGRHFADSLCGYTLKEQLAKIKKYIPTMYNLCLIYGDKEHKGTLASSNKIAEKLKQKGVLI